MTAAVELKGLTKAFGPVLANADIHLRVEPGTIHAVIGENGAGKSTAMKMLYGIYRPDGGEILVDGAPRSWKSPREAIAAGIGMVHQHFMLADPYDTLENIWLGAEPSRPGLRWLPEFLRPVDREGARRRLLELSRRYGLEVPLDARIEDLSVGVQQRIEILKLLYRDARILILDEPTAVLTPQETEALFQNLRTLVKEGKSVILITHKLKEVMAIADRVTVFRAGRVVGEVAAAETTPEELASLMVGRKVSLAAEAPPAPVRGIPVLEVEGLTAPASEAGAGLSELNFSVVGGEIVGVAGVEGNGQSELLHALVHPSELLKTRHGLRASGAIRCMGETIFGDGQAMKADRIKAKGVGMIPEDRHKEGLLLGRPVWENFLLGMQRRREFARGGILRFGSILKSARAAVESYDVRPRSVDALAGGLSGGNQQKLIVAREFETRPGLLIAAQPTRGVDVGAIEFIHGRILEARERGAGVLLVSSELDEILALSDRILVMYGGKIVAQYERGQATERELGLHMGGIAAKGAS